MPVDKRVIARRPDLELSLVYGIIASFGPN
jgi:hypothetical protein